MSCVLRRSLADEFVQQHASDHVERFKHALALVSGRRKRGHLHVPIIEQEFHIVHRRDIWQVPLVELQDIRDFGQIQLEGFEILFKVDEALDVFRHFFVLRIGDKDDAIDAAQDQLAGGVVNDLARNGVKLKLCLKALDGHRLNGQEVKEEGAIRARGERDEFALVAGGGLHVIVDLDQVGGFATHGWSVVNDFDLKLFSCLINNGHNYLGL